MSVSSGPTLAAARFGAQQRKGVLLGFTGPRLAVMGIAALLVTAGLFTAGLAGAILVSPAVAGFMASAFVPVAGRTAVEWFPVAGHWALRRALGQDIYGIRPLTPRPRGTLALPGDAAALRVHVDAASGAAMIHDPHRKTLTATCLVAHPSFVLLGVEEQTRRVVGWGRVLASLSRSGHTAAVQVLEATLPDQGSGVLDWWRSHGHRDGSWAARTYEEFVAAAAPSSAQHRTTISLSLDLRRAARSIDRAGRGLAGAAAVLRADMSALEAALRAAELQPQQWLGEADLARVIRAAYDPASATGGSTAGSGGTIGARLTTAGPVGIHEHWSWLASDGCACAVLWISEWPRSQAYPNFLHTLVLVPGVRKSLSLIARPVPIAQARKDIRRQKVEYVSDAEQKVRIGQIADLSDAAEYQDILQREQEIALGHADLRFAGLIAVTAPDKAALDAALAQIEQAAAQCECETRLLVGQQSQAFAAAALPLGRGL
jgi:hypothetical protein